MSRNFLRSNQRRKSNREHASEYEYQPLEPRQLLAGFNVDFSVLAPSDYTQTEILVRFNDDVRVSDLQTLPQDRSTTNQYSILSGPLGEGFQADGQLFEIPVYGRQSVTGLVAYYNSLSFVDYAEPNYTMQAAAVPNDQFYQYQWGPGNIDAESAWDTRTDSSSLIVGVIDSGVQYDHPDLQGNIWTNSGEIAGNGIDDDNNGYVDDYYGYDFDNDDSDPMDDNGHGTHVAGTIGAQANNTTGVAGVSWDASLMSLKVIGNGSNADVARAIDYATDNGAKITNNSYGYAGTNVGGSQVMSDAIERAKDSGVLYIVAAGNSRSGTPASDVDGNFNSWPAEYSKVHDNVITVSAIDEDGSFASYSHWGDESVQIAAPGTQIASTYTESSYVYLSGTSMAAPHVAGAAALLWAERPDMNYLEIKAAMLETARPDHLNLVTNGVLDLGAAMESITSSTNDPPNAVNDSATVDEDNSVGVAVLSNDSDPDDDVLTLQSYGQGSNGSVTESGGVLTYTPAANFYGSDSFNYTINDGNGNTDSATVFVTVNGVNDSPVANTDSANTDEDVAVIVDVVANDTDIDGDSLFISAVSQASNGSVVDNGDGTVTYTPNGGFFGSDSFTYTVSDGSLSDTATVNITVNEVTGGSNDIGYAGTAIDVTHVWKTVNLPITFSNPVVVAGGSTRDGGHQGVVRVRNVTSDSFEVRFQEWDYRDGRHTTENIGYLVVEAGTHTLTDGTQLVAGTTTLTNEAFKTLSFETSFSATPLVLAHTMTNNDPAAVVERVRSIKNNTFRMQLNEEEAADGVHGTETVGYIAIDKGSATSGDTVLNAVTTSNSVTHQNTTVNFGDIGGASNPVILSDMQTRDGRDASTLRHRSQTSTSVTVWVEEERSRDNELNHTTEVAGVLAMEEGVLVAGSPLQAQQSGNRVGSQPLTQSDLDSVFDDAVGYWSSQGLDTSRLDSVRFVVSDLKNNVIGMQYGQTVVLDVNAAGNGWYVDADVTTTEAFRGMDLYTTVTHELGHALGLADTYDVSHSDDIMYGYLNNGDRKATPETADQAMDDFFSNVEDELLSF
ncbi:MAG: S8 family serine peptidase [Mariniblastus sp.]|nr:S8 family serine peptidase [Mariniblastus sp.]